MRGAPEIPRQLGVSIDTCGWQNRMVNGAPEIKAPPWLDPNRVWRPADNTEPQKVDHAAADLAEADPQ